MSTFIQCLVYTTILQILQVTGSSQNRDGLENLQKYAQNVSKTFQKEITIWAKKYTKYDAIENELNTDSLDYKTLNGKEINKNFVEGLESMFGSKRDILEKIRVKANATRSTYRHIENIGSFDYHNIRKINTSDNVTLKIDKTFSLNVKTNKSYSFVQIPTNIFSENNDVLNTANWTSRLDRVFIENFENSDKTLLYQYYCDSSGLFRIYPGNLNGERNKDNVDLYDCRRRIWYIQASVSPKDVVIVIDISGSMIGTNIGIAKISAASLIDTFQENDFFNVITVNNTVKYLIDDVRYLVQATKENKETMKAELQKLEKPTDIANITLGMNEAFDILKLSGDKYNRSSNADCNKAIIFITDGVEGDYAGKEVFEKRNQDKGVRAFAFLVGRRKSPDKKALVEMACNNRGHFYTIETLGNIWDSVLKYLQVLSRPIGASKKQQPAYTSVYKDSTGLGMIMTVSLGVFGDNDLYGVTGTDISVDSLIENIPQHKLGVFSRGILINNNGFVAVHPKIRKQTGYLPEPANIYLDDVEYGVDRNDTENLKKEMIDRKSNSMSFPTYWLYDGDRKAFESNTEFSFLPVRDTEFSAAIAIADSDKTYFTVLDDVFDKYIVDGIDALYNPIIVNKTENSSAENYLLTQISKWNYCTIFAEGQDPLSRNIKRHLTANELYNYLVGNEIRKASDIPSNCDTELLKRLIVTAGATHRIMKASWNNDLLKSNYYGDNGIVAVYIATIAGYSKFFTTPNTSLPFDRDILKHGIFETAAAFSKASITVSIPQLEHDFEDGSAQFLHVTGSARIGTNDILASRARVTGDFVHHMFINSTQFNSKNSCLLEESNDRKFVCLIVDHSGYVIASNQGNESIGQFMGKYLPALTEEHLAHENISIFKKIELFDTQAECFRFSKHKVSAADILASPFKIIFAITSSLFNGVYSTVIYLTMILMTLFTKHSVEMKTDHDFESQIKITCTRSMPFYIFQEENWKKFKNDSAGPIIINSQCSQNYSLSPIRDTNLIFIIADYVPACLKHRKVSLEHSVTENKEFYNREEGYRRRPTQCFNQTIPNENEKCGSGYMVTPRIILLIFLILMTNIIEQ